MASSAELFKSLTEYIDESLPLNRTSQLTQYLVLNTSATTSVVNTFLLSTLESLFSLSIISANTVEAFNVWVGVTPIQKIKSIFLQLRQVLLSKPAIKLNDLAAFIEILNGRIALNSSVITSLTRFSNLYVGNIPDPDVRSAISNEINSLLTKYTSRNIELAKTVIEMQNQLAGG